MLTCPNCLTTSVQDGQCLACGMMATSDTSLNETNVLALVHNVKVRMQTMGPQQYQQIAGMYSPRAGRGNEDAIDFTELECRSAHRFLLEFNIPCIRIDSTVKRRTLRTLIVAHNEEAIQKALRDARREINRLKGSMRIIRDVSEYT